MFESDIERQKPIVALIKLKHISNFTDFHPLSDTDEIDAIFVDTPLDLTRFKALIIPGSKNTRSDIEWLKKTGWDIKIKDYAKSGGHILGICGGYQILGEYVDDPEGLEGESGKTDGLNLLPVQTILKAPKTTTLSRFSWGGVYGEGYEIHMGQTNISQSYSDKGFLACSNEESLGLSEYNCDSLVKPMLKVHQRNRDRCSDFDGAISKNGNICGTYMHGFFDSWGIRKKWLEHIGIKMVCNVDNLAFKKLDRVERKNRDYQLLKEYFQRYVNIDEMLFKR